MNEKGYSIKFQTKSSVLIQTSNYEPNANRLTSILLQQRQRPIRRKVYNSNYLTEEEFIKTELNKQHTHYFSSHTTHAHYSSNDDGTKQNQLPVVRLGYPSVSDRR